MSYGVVRAQKFGSGSVKGIQIHDRREKSGISHTNKDIYWSKTHLNYDLCPIQNKNFNKAVKERIEQLPLKRSVRKDAVVMAQILVTSDHEFFEDLTEERQRSFFEDSYEFLKKRYGENNIISSTVHLDEKTPHMHFNFVPVTADGRLSAKSVLTRQSLIEQQDLFFEKVGKKYGLQRGERGGIKIHLETAEFKKQMAINKAIEADRKAQEAFKEFERVKGLIEHLKPLQTEYGAKRVFLDTLEEDIEKSFTLPDMKPVEKGFLKKETVVEIPWQQWQELKENIEKVSKEMLAHERANQRATDRLTEEIKQFKKTSTGQYIAQLERELNQVYIEKHEVEDIAGELTHERDTLKKEKGRLIEVFEEEKVKLIENHEREKRDLALNYNFSKEVLEDKLKEWDLFLKSLPEEFQQKVRFAKASFDDERYWARQEEINQEFSILDKAKVELTKTEKERKKDRGFSR